MLVCTLVFGPADFSPTFYPGLVLIRYKKLEKNRFFRFSLWHWAYCMILYSANRKRKIEKRHDFLSGRQSVRQLRRSCFFEPYYERRQGLRRDLNSGPLALCPVSALRALPLRHEAGVATLC